jgi:hypothetical protein
VELFYLFFFSVGVVKRAFSPLDLPEDGEKGWILPD